MKGKFLLISFFLLMSFSNVYPFAVAAREFLRNLDEATGKICEDEAVGLHRKLVEEVPVSGCCFDEETDRAMDPAKRVAEEELRPRVFLGKQKMELTQKICEAINTYEKESTELNRLAVFFAWAEGFMKIQVPCKGRSSGL